MSDDAKIPLPNPITLDAVPAFATSVVMIASATSFAAAAANAVQAQQCGAILMNASTARGVASILKLNSLDEKSLFDALETAMGLPT